MKPDPHAQQLGYVDAVTEGVATILLKNDQGEWRGWNFPVSLFAQKPQEASWVRLHFVRTDPPENPVELRQRLGDSVQNHGDRGRQDDGGDFSL